MPIKKVVVIGPESTGKSTLCAALAAHYQTAWVREYAREYLQEHGMDYKYDDLLAIARGQLAGEDRASRDLARAQPAAEDLARAQPPAAGKDGLLFIDTDLYVIKVWSEFVFGRCETWILEEIARRKYDAYLLCKPDLPWADDPLREYPDPAVRHRLYGIYHDLLVNQNTPWAEIGGEESARVRNGIAAVERLL